MACICGPQGSGGGGSGGAPTGAQYLVLAAHATLTDERVFALGNGVDATDGGPGGNYTLTVDETELDHNLLSNLSTEDAHTQYALLAGRAAGQILIGGTGAGDDLTLRATSHATDGDIIFQTDPTTEIGRFTSTGLGIGTTPAATFWLHVKNLASGNTPTLIEGNGAGNGGYVSFRDGNGTTVSGSIGHSGALIGSGTGFAATYAAGDFRFGPIGDQGVLIQPTTAGNSFLSVAGFGAGYGGYVGVYGAPGVRVGLVGHEGPITGSGSRLAFQGDAGALVRGGTSASNNLELSSTSHATKGVITSDSVFRGPDGTSSAPTYSFTNDTDTGMSQTGPGILDLYVGGDIKMRMQSGQIAIGDDATLVSGVTLAIKHSPSSTSTVQENLRITRATTGVGAVGLGSRSSVFLEDGSNNEKESWDRDIVVTTATAASMTVRCDYYLRIANVLEATYQVTATTEAGGVWDVKPQTANEGNLGTSALPWNLVYCGTITLSDAANIVLGSTTGTKIGTATTQKLGFYNATPVVQATGIVDADGTLADITTKFNSLLGKLETYGLLAVA